MYDLRLPLYLRRVCLERKCASQEIAMSDLPHVCCVLNLAAEAGEKA